VDKLFLDIEKSRDNLSKNIKEEKEKRDTAEKKLSEVNKKYEDSKRHYIDMKSKLEEKMVELEKLKNGGALKNDDA
jgi:SMC interacting uncharacterized protein involved in chromosome segregation